MTLERHMSRPPGMEEMREAQPASTSPTVGGEYTTPAPKQDWRRLGVRGIRATLKRHFIRGLPWSAIALAGVVIVAVVLVVAVTCILVLSTTTLGAASLPIAGSSLVANTSADDINGAESDALLGDEELADVADELRRETPGALACLRDSPPVGGAANPSRLMSREENEAMVDAERERRREVERTWQRKPQNRAEAQELRAAKAREKQYRQRWDEDRRSRFVGRAPVAPGEQVTRDGQLDKRYSNLINDVPEGAPGMAAATYVVVALAGGIDSWEHFAEVVAAKVPGGLSGVDSSNQRLVYSLFFDGGFDPAPYERVAQAMVVPRIVDGSLSDRGDAEVLIDGIVDCFDGDAD